MMYFFLRRSGYSYKVAVALSLFLGWIGADRFYLGYPALGKTQPSLLFYINKIVELLIHIFLCTHLYIDIMPANILNRCYIMMLNLIITFHLIKI